MQSLAASCSVLHRCTREASTRRFPPLIAPVMLKGICACLLTFAYPMYLNKNSGSGLYAQKFFDRDRATSCEGDRREMASGDRPDAVDVMPNAGFGDAAGISNGLTDCSAFSPRMTFYICA